MFLLIAGLILFLGIHSVSIFAEGFRNRMAAKSELGWKAVYALISIAGIALIAIGYSQVRLTPTFVYQLPYGFRHVTYLLMLPAFILLVAPYFPGKIKQITKHPQLLGVKLWALAHLLVNGMLADIILFGAFLVWAGIDRASLKRRTPRAIPGAPANKLNDLIAVILGVVLTVAFIFYLHGKLIGIPLVS